VSRDIDLAKSDAVRLERERLRNFALGEIRDESTATDASDRERIRGWNAALAAVRARLT
jgi:hypothetical protein